jgi:putative addiction module component (TIGR02574 family)
MPMMHITDLIEEALHLPQTERSYLASKLLESLDEDDHEVSEEWLVEINRRADALKNGTSQLTPHDQVMTEVRQGLAQIRSSHQS